MARKRKTKKKVPETECYDVEVEDWEVDYSFGINTTPTKCVDGVYSEYPTIILSGKILSPPIKNASKARMRVSADPQVDDYWAAKPTIISAKAIGSIILLKEEETLEFLCSTPTRSLPLIAVAAEAKKLKYASIYGTKLKWRQGTIARLSLSTTREEE